MLAKKDLPVSTLPEFIAYAKERPGVLNFGSSGVGSLVHLSGELLMHQTGVKMQHVPYRGGANSMTDLLGGDARRICSPARRSRSDRCNNKGLKMLAVTSRYRLHALPQVPHHAGSGLEGLRRDRLARRGRTGRTSGIRSRQAQHGLGGRSCARRRRKPRLRAIGFEPIGTDAAAFDKFYRAEVKRWTDFVKERGIKATQ